MEERVAELAAEAEAAAAAEAAAEAAAAAEASEAGLTVERRMTLKAHEKISKLLLDRPAFKKELRHCWSDATGLEDGSGSLDLSGLEAFCASVEATLGIPVGAFGEMSDTYERFDFNG